MNVIEAEKCYANNIGQRDENEVCSAHVLSEDLLTGRVIPKYQKVITLESGLIRAT